MKVKKQKLSADSSGDLVIPQEPSACTQPLAHQGAGPLSALHTMIYVVVNARVGSDKLSSRTDGPREEL
jgi:hypothetical protein